MVQRLLPLQPGMPQTYGVINPIKNKSNRTDDISEYTHDEQSGSGTIQSSIGSAEKSLLTSENLNRINAHQLNDVNDVKRVEMCETMNINQMSHDSDTEEDDEDDDDNGQSNDLSDDNDDENTRESNNSDEVSRRLNEDPGIQSLLDISLPSPFPVHGTSDECMYFKQILTLIKR